MTSRIAATVVELLFAQECLLCGDSLLLNAAECKRGLLPLCRSCFDGLSRPTGPRCRCCSQPLISEIDLCMRCRDRSFPFESNRSIFLYRGAAKRLVHEYKFHNEIGLSLLFASLLAEKLRSDYTGMVAVPVPARPANVRKRGWDPLGVIGRRLRRDGFPVVQALRRRNAKAQKSLDFVQRSTNLRGKILLSRAGRRLAATNHSARGPGAVVLLDDVFTTGATASECATVLLAAGIERVSVLTIAID